MSCAPSLVPIEFRPGMAEFLFKKESLIIKPQTKHQRTKINPVVDL
jgi:hypothetical protein